MNYFRITGYCKEKNVCFIADCNGKFQALWQFSSFLVKKGIEIVAVEKIEGTINSNIPLANADADCLIFRACDIGRPQISDNVITIRGKFYEHKK